MNKINREDYQDDEIFEQIPETYPNYATYAIRNYSIFDSWRKGETYDSLAKHYNVNKETIRQIILKQCRRYDYLKNLPIEHEIYMPSNKYDTCRAGDIWVLVIGSKDWRNTPRDKKYTRVANVLVHGMKKYLNGPMSDFLKAIIEMTDEDYLKLRNAGPRTLPIFHEVRDEARRRLKEDDSRVDTSDGEAT